MKIAEKYGEQPFGSGQMVEENRPVSTVNE